MNRTAALVVSGLLVLAGLLGGGNPENVLMMAYLPWFIRAVEGS